MLSGQTITRIKLATTALILLVAPAVHGQSRKPGLWELTTTTTLSGAQPSAPRVSQICLAQAMIDKYGAIVPHMQSGCQVSNVVKKADGMTADMSCTGMMTGTATLEATYTDAEHATASVHFTGSVESNGSPHQIEWTSHSTSVFKSASCGEIKPYPMPDEKQ